MGTHITGPLRVPLSKIAIPELPGEFVPRPSLRHRLDGATAALAAGAFAAAVIFERVADVTEGSNSVVVTNLSYPLGDVLLLSAVFGVFSLTGWRPGPRRSS